MYFLLQNALTNEVLLHDKLQYCFRKSVETRGIFGCQSPDFDPLHFLQWKPLPRHERFPYGGIFGRLPRGFRPTSFLNDFIRTSTSILTQTYQSFSTFGFRRFNGKGKNISSSTFRFLLTFFFLLEVHTVQGMIALKHLRVVSRSHHSSTDRFTFRTCRG